MNERGNERTQKFDSNWNLILIWGTKGSSDYEFYHIELIVLDKYDNVYVADPHYDSGCSQQPRVLKFGDRKFITKFDGSFGEDDCQFQDPKHLAIDSECSLCVSDRKRDDIQKFASVID